MKIYAFIGSTYDGKVYRCPTCDSAQLVRHKTCRSCGSPRPANYRSHSVAVDVPAKTIKRALEAYGSVRSVK